MRDGKGDKQKGNNGNSDTPGALFPRLHVKEARNNGPRAPPRNKMALYEQLTIPSHRFQQQQQQQQNTTPQTQPVPQAFLPQSYTGGYYLPYYMTPPMAFQPMNVVMGQQPMSNPTNYDMECDQGELQRVPGGANNEHLMRVASLRSKNVPTSNSNSKKVSQKEDHEDFAVPTYASKVKGVASSSVANSTVSTAEENQASNQAGKNIPSRLVRTAGSHNLERPMAEANINLQRPHRTGVDNQVVNEVAVRVNEARLRGNEVRFRGDEAQAHNQSPSRSFDSNGGIDNQSDEEGVQPEEEETSDDSAQSVLDNTAPYVSSKDVMSAVGDEQFWKMRKAMQRQQHIFNKQLFELHRLTKVQQLMAASGIHDGEDTCTQQEQEKNDDAAEEDTREAQEDSLKITESETEDKQANTVVSREEDFVSPQPPKSPEVQPYDYNRYPPAMNNMGFPPFPGFPQWYAPVPVQFPPSFPGVYNTPYGPMLSGPPPSYMPYGIEQRPYVPYNCEQRPNMMPLQWQQGYYPEAGVQWMGGPGYMNPVGQSSMGSFKDNSQSQAGAASSSQSRRFHSSQAGSTAGFVPPRPDSRQQPQPQPQHQQKLVGKYVEGKEASSSKSPYARPSGFHVFNGGSNGDKPGKVIKVTPKAAMVTAESAAEILQSIRQERPEI